MYALHFGIVPTAPAHTPGIFGYREATTEKRLDVSWIDPERIDPNAYVSGSWRCWGPDDQETDGDNTLHVVVYVTEVTPGLAVRIGEALALHLDYGSRLLDYAIVSGSDWSEQDYAVHLADGALYTISTRDSL